MSHSKGGSRKLTQNQKIAEVLLEHLMDHYLEETKTQCESLGFSVDELYPL